MNFKKRMRKLMGSLFFIFILMFIFRFIFGYISYPSQSYSNQNHNTSFASGINTMTNIASTRYEIKKGKTSNNQVISVDQKFEKIGSLTCRSSKFDEDEQKIRATVQSESAIIQVQKKSGTNGNQQLYLQIGVQPEKFDRFIEMMKNFLDVINFSVAKTDKTNEYRELNSKIKTLQTTRSSLMDLKSKGGKIEEYIQLENRILAIDEKLQQLGVQMGSFDSENEFCTVNISLKEGKTLQIGIFQRIKVALEWTIQYYLFLMFGVVLSLISAFLLLTILDKLKIIAGIRDKMRED